MVPTEVAVAAFEIGASYWLVGVALRLAVAAAKKLAKRTRTKKDDHVVQTIDEFLIEHPEALPAVMNLIDTWRK